MPQEEELERAVLLVKAGNKNEAIPILKSIIKLDRNNERAWLWLSFCVDKPDDKIFCFQQVLRINPDNQHTRIALAQLEHNPIGGKDVIPIPQPAIIEEQQKKPELVNNKMMYNGERNNYIVVKCGNCNKPFTVPQEQCVRIENCYKVNPSSKCSHCGTVVDTIYGVEIIHKPYLDNKAANIFVYIFFVVIALFLIGFVLLLKLDNGTTAGCIFGVIILLIIFLIMTVQATENQAIKEGNLKNLNSQDDIEVGKHLTGLQGLVEPNTIVSCAVTENDFVFLRPNGIQIDKIPRNSINQIIVDSRAQITKRITVTRLLTLGIFSLAFPKTEKNYCLLIDWDNNDGTRENIVFEFSGDDSNVKANKAVNRLKGYVKPKIERLKPDEKKCPYCAELIKREAVVCRFCGRDLPLT